MTATKSVVTLASIIVLSEFVLPFLNAVSKLTPFLNSSLIRAKLSTLASTAIPIPNNIAAIPGSVKTPPTNQNIPNVITVYINSPTADIKPANLYSTTIRIITSAIPTIPAKNVLSNELAPNDAPTVLEDISSNLVGKFPELIKSTNFLTSSVVKLP